MNSWYGGRNAKDSDCNWMCTSGDRAWCKHSVFSTAGAGTCDFYDCVPGGGGITEAEAKAAVGLDFPTPCGPCNPDHQVDAPPVDNAGYSLTWSDEFDSPGGQKQGFNTSKWTAVDKGGGFWNQELQYYSPRESNVWVSDGTLKIKAVYEQPKYKDHRYSSAKLESKNVWTYGMFEVRARLNNGCARGTWPAHWMMPRPESYGYWPKSGEIDIMEHVGYQTGKVHGTVHTEDYNHRIGTQQGKTVPNVNMNAWHTYSVDWRPDSVSFSLDGAAPYNTFRKQGASSAKWPFNKDFYMILNMAVGGSWGGVQGVDQDAFKGSGQVMEIDWVRVYQKQEWE